jgi:ubiquinone/menaquinone biosynthesis C-methylase UbiE
MAGTDNVTEMVVERPEQYWRGTRAAEGYDAGRFDNLEGRLYRWREERAIRLALRGVQPESRVLDAACGTGRITALLQLSGFQATGCDISLAMMTVARRRLTSLGHDVPFVESRLEQLPYPDGSFEAVTCVGLLMHFDADFRIQALNELARVSRGRLVVQYGCVDTLQRAKARITGRPPGGVRCPVSEVRMQEDFERSGLTERARYWILRGVSSSLVVLLSRSGCA